MNIKKLKEIAIFSHLSDSELEQMLTGNGARTKRYSKGDIIRLQGDEVRGLHILCEGCIKNSMGNEQGKSITVEKMQAPTLFAPAFVFATDNHFPVNVMATTDCEVTVVGREHLLRHMAANELFMLDILRVTADRCAFLTRRLREFALNDLKARIRGYIKEHGAITNQAEVAQILGVARPSLARALSELERMESKNKSEEQND